MVLIFRYSLSVGFLLALLYATIKGEPEGNDPDCEYLKNMLALVQKKITQMPACASELNLGTSSLRYANFMCIIRCTMSKLGVLGEDGLISIAGSMELLESVVPPSMRNDTIDALIKCQGAASKIDPSDTTCEGYEPLLSCALGAITTTLRSSIPKILKSGLGGTNRISPVKMVKCGALAGRVEGELLKFDFQSTRRIF